MSELLHSLQPAVSELRHFWPHVVAATHVIVAALASAHAILHKRDPRSAAGWVGLIWLSPFVGATLYLLFGINRIRRKAIHLKKMSDTFRSATQDSPIEKKFAPYLEQLVIFGNNAVGKPLTDGNAIMVLRNGEQTYPAMVEAIHSARESVSLCTYIFDKDSAGKLFVDALSSAVQRGVEVRVLIDAVGARYSFPSVLHVLHKKKIPAARFLPTLVPWRMPYMNLRNHRKILIVDGKTGFTGGLNIRQGHCVSTAGAKAIRDLHFHLNGPVVKQLQEAFTEDWAFTTGEILSGKKWFPTLSGVGSALARGIPDGPGEDFEKIKWIILGAISMAKSSIRIVTPYFVPDASIITSLNIAAMSGVKVEVVLPANNNLRYVQWASMALLWQILKYGCRVFLSQGVFDHSKIMTVDDSWALIGSSNWDSRSLRLNFEFNVEAYDKDFATTLVSLFEERKKGSEELTLKKLEMRSLPIRLRDGICRLFLPYL